MCIRYPMMALIKSVSKRDDIKIVGICVNKYEPYHVLLFHYVKAEIKKILQYMFGNYKTFQPLTPPPLNLKRLAKKYDFDILIPPDNDVNDPSFIQKLRDEIKPTLAFSWYFQIFSPDFLKLFDYGVNYHNGTLPQYRGTNATRWSLYHEARESGFTFHRLTENIDGGNVLYTGVVPINDNSNNTILEYQKVREATRIMSRIVDMCVRRDEGMKQTGNSTLFTNKYFLNMQKIEYPKGLTSQELIRRLRAFNFLKIQINGSWYGVSKFKIIDCEKGKLCFKAHDGVVIKPIRFFYLPFFIYNLIRKITGCLIDDGTIIQLH